MRRAEALDREHGGGIGRARSGSPHPRGSLRAPARRAPVSHSDCRRPDRSRPWQRRGARRRRHRRPGTLGALLGTARQLDEALRSGGATIQGDRVAVARFLSLCPLPKPAGPRRGSLICRGSAGTPATLRNTNTTGGSLACSPLTGLRWGQSALRSRARSWPDLLRLLGTPMRADESPGVSAERPKHEVRSKRLMRRVNGEAVRSRSGS
jgi:hypothetical protein